MKKTMTLKLLPALVGALLLLTSQTAKAQDSEIVGYANAFIRISAYPEDGGKVCAGLNNKTLKIWSTTFNFNTTFPVATLLGMNYISYFVYNQPADGYIFAGWYEDTDADGQFDVDKDALISTESEIFEMPTLDDDTVIYPTEAAAKSGEKPNAPQRTLFAYFSCGATVSMANAQDEAHANCGSVFIDKKINNPGDVVTVRALPNDGFQFEYWEDAPLLGNIVSRDATYTFTVNGGEQLYAYFSAIDAPTVELPAEGGYKVLYLTAPWAFHEDALKNGAHVLVMEREDLTRTADGKTYLDSSKEECQIDIAQIGGQPTIVSGKGTVRFAYKYPYGSARELAANALVRWSGSKGVTINQEFIYVYLFHEGLGAFVQYGNTDTMMNPSASTKITVPAGWAYIAMTAYDLVDGNGNIPTVIGLTPDVFSGEVTGIEGIGRGSREVCGTKIYTLSGIEVKTTDKPGIYIINGKKHAIK